MNEFDGVLDFWFGALGSPEYGSFREMWFEGGPALDAEITARFGALYQRAAAGELDDWRDEAGPCLALILVLDQFPRNMFRGAAESFATDAKAATIAGHAVDRGYDKDLPHLFQQFYYMPFEHGENIADQRRSVALFRASADDERKPENIEYAVKHLEIIERFGHFPHRNSIVGRESTAEELEFLEDGGDDAHFGTKPEQTN